ncbi:MAG: FAD-dependent oxidoreductase [Thermomicrobiales bacterium]
MQQKEQHVDIVVIGAGPAGIAAAITAAKTGASTVLLDEAPAAGGHLRWEVADFDALPVVPEKLELSSLAIAACSELAESDVVFHPNTPVWGIFPGPVVAAHDSVANEGLTFRATAVIIATGTVDRLWPVRGWELAGFCSERQLLAELHDQLPAPGRRYAIIGGGGAAEQLRAAIALTGGAVLFESIDINKIRIQGKDKVEAISDDEQEVDVDVVVQAFGQRIEPTLAIQAGATCTLHVGEAVPTPYLTADGATTIPGIYVAGEAAGVSGPRWAYTHGERVGGAAAAQSPPHPTPEPIVIDPDNPRRPYFPPPLYPEIIVDREQNVTLGEITAAIDAGAYDINDIRRQTRAGMGPSSSNEALPVIATLLLWRDRRIADERLIARPRPPVREVPFANYVPEDNVVAGTVQ